MHRHADYATGSSCPLRPLRRLFLPLHIFLQPLLAISLKAAAAPLAQYDEAPNTPDTDDPAIYVRHNTTLLIGTAKDSGLGVWSMNSSLVQWIAPPNRPTVSAEDPPTPAGLNTANDDACLGSAPGDTYGRFNGVAQLHNVEIDGRQVDIAVVTGRGCDRLRFYAVQGYYGRLRTTAVSHAIATAVAVSAGGEG